MDIKNLYEEWGERWAVTKDELLELDKKVSPGCLFYCTDDGVVYVSSGNGIKKLSDILEGAKHG